jgi:hypothetical protein
MIVNIQDAKSPKQAWDTLVKMYNTNTQARKMQLKQELHNLQKNKMNISDYFTKVKNLVDALTFIGAPVDDEDLVAVTSNGLGKNYSQFRTSLIVRKTFPNFQDLIILLISEEMRVVGTSSNGGSQESAFYSKSNRGRGRGAKTSFGLVVKYLVLMVCSFFLHYTSLCISCDENLEEFLMLCFVL